jgi:hypothetical protein
MHGEIDLKQVEAQFSWAVSSKRRIAMPSPGLNSRKCVAFQRGSFGELEIELERLARGSASRHEILGVGVLSGRKINTSNTRCVKREK